MTKVFHELADDTVDTTMQRGLLLGTAGEKTDTEIHKTDLFLNQYRPASLIRRGVDRVKNNYCYLSSDNGVIDILSGEAKSLQEFKAQHKLALLQIEVDPKACYVSDLNIYDQIKQLLRNTDLTNARRLAYAYWGALVMLGDYHGDIQRPEVMVTYNIPPLAITKIG